MVISKDDWRQQTWFSSLFAILPELLNMKYSKSNKKWELGVITGEPHSTHTFLNYNFSVVLVSPGHYGGEDGFHHGQAQAQLQLLTCDQNCAVFSICPVSSMENVPRMQTLSEQQNNKTTWWYNPCHGLGPGDILNSVCTAFFDLTLTIKTDY